MVCNLFVVNSIKQLKYLIHIKASSSSEEPPFPDKLTPLAAFLLILFFFHFLFLLLTLFSLHTPRLPPSLLVLFSNHPLFCSPPPQPPSPQLSQPYSSLPLPSFSTALCFLSNAACLSIPFLPQSEMGRNGSEPWEVGSLAPNSQQRPTTSSPNTSLSISMALRALSPAERTLPTGRGKPLTPPLRPHWVPPSPSSLSRETGTWDQIRLLPPPHPSHQPFPFPFS